MSSFKFYDSPYVGVVYSKEEEAALIKKARNGDTDARDRILLANVPFVVYASSRYDKCGLSKEDLVQTGVMGLIIALDKFDFSKNVRFITFASNWVRHEILNEIENTARVIRMPQNRENQLIAIRKILASLPKDIAPEEKKKSVCNILSIKESVYDNIMEISQGVASLDKNIGEDKEMSFHEVLDAGESYEADYDLMKKELKSGINKALSVLTPKEQTVLKLRAGIDCEKEMSLRSVGEIVHATKEGVRHIEKRAFEKIRGSGAVKYLDGFIAA